MALTVFDQSKVLLPSETSGQALPVTRRETDVQAESIPSRKMSDKFDLDLIREKKDKPIITTIPIHRIHKLIKRRETKKIKATYTDYLRTFIKPEDRRYLKGEKVALSLIPLRAGVGEVIRHTPLIPRGMFFRFSDYENAKDPLITAVAEREKLNGIKTISTIVFISTRDNKGFSVSGYIDLEQSIRRFREGTIRSHPWSEISSGQRRLQPNSQDLSFIAWKNGQVAYNDSDNYKVIPDAVNGLCFLYKGDGSMLYIEKYITGDHPSCIYIESPKHGSAVIYDHRIRRKL